MWTKAQKENSILFRKEWFEDLKNNGGTPEQIAAILYGAAMYNYYGEKINLGGTFGSEYSALGLTAGGIYSQMDKIAEYKGTNEKMKFNPEQIKKMRLKGMTQREIAEAVGATNYKSISSNKGWIEAGEELKRRKEDVSVQKSTENVQNVTEKVQKNVPFQF